MINGNEINDNSQKLLITPFLVKLSNSGISERESCHVAETDRSSSSSGLSSNTGSIFKNKILDLSLK